MHKKGKKQADTLMQNTALPITVMIHNDYDRQHLLSSLTSSLLLGSHLSIVQHFLKRPNLYSTESDTIHSENNS